MSKAVKFQLRCSTLCIHKVADAPELLSADDLEKVHLLGLDLASVWDADSTTNRDRKRLLRCLIEEVQLSTEEDHYTVRIV